MRKRKSNYAFKVTKRGLLYRKKSKYPFSAGLRSFTVEKSDKRNKGNL